MKMKSIISLYFKVVIFFAFTSCKLTALHGPPVFTDTYLYFGGKINYAIPTVNEMRDTYKKNQVIYDSIILLSLLLMDTSTVRLAKCYKNLDIYSGGIYTLTKTPSAGFFETQCKCNCFNIICLEKPGENDSDGQLFLNIKHRLESLERKLKIRDAIYIDSAAVIIPYKKIQENIKEDKYRSFCIL